MDKTKNYTEGGRGTLLRTRTPPGTRDEEGQRREVHPWQGKTLPCLGDAWIRS